ncbi:MAG: SDR family oxidoreductase [bacterium]|nr:SDR family oxidoreductase [bacterium]
MKILLTGGTGLLGKSIIDNKEDRDEIISIYKGNYFMANSTPAVKHVNIDILDKNKILDIILSFKPEYLVHCASIGSPDFAQKYQQDTWTINVEGTSKIVDICNKTDTKLIYISSNGIYRGDNAPYSEYDKAHPVNFYGKTKLEAEEVAKNANEYTIVRPILMYGWNNKCERNNIVTLLLEKLNNNEKIFVYNDVFCNPLYSVQCAQAIWKIIKNGHSGEFNIGGGNRVSIYELIKKVAIIFNKDPDLVNPIQQGYFGKLVKRPVDTSFNTTKMENILNIKPLTLEEGLCLMKKTCINNLL